MNFLQKLFLFSVFALFTLGVSAQEHPSVQIPQEEQIQEVSEDNLRPSVKAYLDYLKQELTVTDAPESRREVSQSYIRHNFNRVSALRTFALKLAGETETDFIPEMEAVTIREFSLLFFDKLPKISDLKRGEVYNSSYRFLGQVKNIETFYIFARLDPYEEEKVRKQVRAETEKPANIEVKTETKPEAISKMPEIVEKTSPPETEKPVNTLTRERFLREIPRPNSTVRTNPPN